MAKNPDYQNWDYEKSDDELEEEQSKPKYAPSVIDIDPAQKSIEIRNKQEEEQQKAELLKKKAAAVAKRKTDWTYDDKRRAAIVMQKWMKMAIQRRRFK